MTLNCFCWNFGNFADLGGSNG